MKVILINVEISNILDSSIRNVLMTYTCDDKNTINYLTESVNLHVDLCEYSGEKILRIYEIKPMNISSDAKRYNLINEIFN